MALLSLSISGPNVGEYAFTRELADADAARILSAYAAILGPVADGEGGQRARTPTEIVDGIASGFLAGVLDNTFREEQDQAAAAARAAVTRIVPPEA